MLRSIVSTSIDGHHLKPELAQLRRRRTHPDALKAQIVAKYSQPAVSVRAWRFGMA
jgi:transposase-like protein